MGEARGLGGRDGVGARAGCSVSKRCMIAVSAASWEAD